MYGDIFISFKKDITASQRHGIKKEYLFVLLLITLCKSTRPNKFNRNKKISAGNNYEEVEFSSETTMLFVISTIVMGLVTILMYNDLHPTEIFNDQIHRQHRRG